MLSEYVWLLFALYAATAYGVSRLFYRHLMRNESPYAFSLLLSFGGFLASLPLVGFQLVLPSGWYPWLFVLLSTILWAAILWIANVSFKHTPASVREPIVQTELIWVFLLSILFLQEKITLVKVVGTLSIFAGMLIVTVHGKFIRASFGNYGVRMTLLTAVLSAFVVIVDKIGVSYFSAGFYNSLLYLTPGLVLLLFLPGRTKEVKHMLRFKWKKLIFASMLSASMYFSVLKAYSLAEASRVYPITLLGSVIVIFGGMLVFREERTHVLRKTVAALLIVFGAACVAGTVFF
jgi:bacterial/archaeal transporter family protein